MSWTTAKELDQSSRCLPVGDVVYYPKRVDPYDPGKTQQALREMWQMKGLPKALPRHLRELVPEKSESALILIPLQQDYDYCVEMNKKEPRWIKKTPDLLKGNFRAWATIGGAGRDVFMARLNLPNTQVRYVIMDGGLARRVADAFNLYRLGNVLQLANLHFPVFAKAGVDIVSVRFSHTRLMHALDVYAVMTLMVRNNHNNLTRHQKIHSRVAALVHDALTPAGGDGTKAINPIALDEDLNFPILLRGEQWKKLKKKLGLSCRLLTETILGKGVLGTLLDIADKVAYVARDLFWYGRCLERNEFEDFPASFQEVINQARKDPYACDVWESVNISGDQVFFTDVERLRNFLTLRVLLFKNLYFHAGARPIESIISLGVVGFLYESGVISIDQLRAWSDSELDRAIEDFLGIPCCMGFSYHLGEVFYEDFKTLEEAKKRQTEVNEDPQVFSFIEDMAGKIKPATHFLVKNSSGKIIPFSEACPLESEEIMNRSLLEKPFFLHYIRSSRMKGEILEKIKKYLISKTSF